MVLLIVKHISVNSNETSSSTWFFFCLFYFCGEWLDSPEKQGETESKNEVQPKLRLRSIITVYRLSLFDPQNY